MIKVELVSLDQERMQGVERCDFCFVVFVTNFSHSHMSAQLAKQSHERICAGATPEARVYYRAHGKWPRVRRRKCAPKDK